MAKITPVLWNSRPSKSGKYPIKIRVTNTIAGKTTLSYFPIGYSVTPDQWNETDEIVKKNHPLMSEINLKIKDMVYSFEKKDLKGEVLKPGNTESFFWWFDEFLKLSKVENSETTYDNYFRLRNCLKDYCKTDITLKQVDVTFIDNLKTHLFTYGFNQNKKGLSPNSVLIYLESLKAVANYILGHENVDWKSPFIKRKGKGIKRQKNEKPRLTLEQIIHFKNFELTGEHKLARDMWCAAFWGGGMRIWDVLLLNENWIQNNTLVYKTHKVKVKIELPLDVVPEFIHIMREYNFRFPFNCDENTSQREIRRINSNYDGHLKRAAKKAGLPPISYHSARYSFLDHLILMGLTPTEAQVTIGHGTVLTTIRYMKEGYREQTNQAMIKAFPPLSIVA